MKSLEVAVPTMYADHHVIEVRRVLFEIPGVETIDASAAFKVVEIGYDAEKTSEDILRQTLDEAGYLREIPIPAETGKPAVGRDGPTFFRHTANVDPSGEIISFGQEIESADGPSWPCPGMGNGSPVEEGEPDHG